MGRVLFVACTNVGKGMIEEIMNNENITKTEIVGVVNINPVLGVSKANYFDYIDVTSKYNIPLFYCNNINDPECIEWIRDKNPDLIIQTGWSQYFKSEILSLPKYGCIGEHPAPLPRGRGAACVNWAIITGEKEWGDTFFQMVAKYDEGKMYAQGFFKIEEYDNVKTIYDKVAATSRKIIAKHIDDWSNGILNGVTQNDENATNYHRRTPDMGQFDFSVMPALECHNFVRGQTHPYPGAFILHDGKKLTILASKFINLKSNSEPGSILKNDENDGSVDFVCSDRKILRVFRVETDRAMECWASDYFK